MKSQLIAMIAQTPIHAGAGSSSGYIDLPIQREAHTDWPCVYGSGVKGALRAAAQINAGDDSQKKDQLKWLFGPETGAEDAGGAGALVVSDARLLLLPVRSLTGHFRWVTCRAVLKRLADDLRRVGKDEQGLPGGLTPDPNHAWVASPVEGNRLYLDELHFTAVNKDKDLESLCTALTKVSGIDAASLKAQLAVLHDDRFAYLARFSTPVAMHVALDKNKTVKRGQLWTEETLPADTVLYTTVQLETRAEQMKNVDLTTLASLSFARGYLQIGGNETVGMGFVHMRPASL